MTSRYFYDTEFLEDGVTIQLISIGIVSDDGRTYYAVNEAAARGRLRARIKSHTWLMTNVVPHLTGEWGTRRNRMPQSWLFDYHAPEVRKKEQIAADVSAFITGSRIELWAAYGAYDHVALMQLYGPMIDRPRHMPMVTHDIIQAAHAVGAADRLPVQQGTAHNALDDAQHVKQCYDMIASYDQH